MKMNKKNKIKCIDALRRSTSFLLALAIIMQITYPTQVWALTGGPSQPEVQSFEPVGTSDMVDLASGDFNYNIPLLDIDGYPINIAYHGGITMDQEASWVGLGWNINPGVVNRNVRGLPDDFSGDLVSKTLNVKENRTWGVSGNTSAEVVGLPLSFGLTQGFAYNNYTGPSIFQGTNLSLKMGSSKGAAGCAASLGLNSSSEDGLTIQPSLSFQATIKNKGDSENSLGLSIGTAFNSRAGLKALSVSASYSRSNKKDSGKKNDKGEAIFDSFSSAIGSSGVSSTFDIGMPTYTPSITTSMKNYGFSGDFSLGSEVYTVHPKIGLSGFYSSQKIAHTLTVNPAYGYLYAENGEFMENALMDFNREKDGEFTENTAFLPIANFTYDTYGVSGQGVGGSYRLYRSDVGHVFDPAAYTTNDDEALTVEFGVGGWIHAGTNIGVTDVSGHSGKWSEGNLVASTLKFSKTGTNRDYEPAYFKEANEKTIDSDTSFYATANYDNPVGLQLDALDEYEHTTHFFPEIKRKKRDKRSNVISYVKRGDYNAFALQPVTNTYASNSSHIAEVTSLGTSGERYVYGIAAYNKLQKETTFSVGSTEPLSVASNVSADPYSLASTGLVSYSATDNSTGNLNGNDNYYSCTATPPFAHSYLLTAVLSADYIDADNVRGPSDNDYGSYTRFVYKKTEDAYKWRTPFEFNKASYNEGLKSDLQDDKANFIYGEKELWYLDSVVTKNYVAKFFTSNRDDAVGVAGEAGGYNSSNSKRMQKLDSIVLFSKQDLKLHPATATPIKTVHFVYSYSLCCNIPNVAGTPGSTKGKLTLKKIFFSYEHSNKARLTPYVFDYHENVALENPQYNLKGYDRWGNYKANNASTLGVSGAMDISTFVLPGIEMSPAEYPYVNQNPNVTNTTAAVWSLKEITLPSGGKISITYESDDYAYVQDRQAMQMFKIVNYDDSTVSTADYIDITTGGGKFYFELQDGITDIKKYTDGITGLYFRCLVKIRGNVGGYDHIEYVSGYGTLKDAGVIGSLGWVEMEKINLKDDDSGTDVNPVAKTAVQFGRLYMPKKVWTHNATSTFGQATGTEGSSGLSSEILDALVNSDFTKNIRDAATGPDQSLYKPESSGGYGVAREIVNKKSWIRLNNPNKHKLGGGARVKKIVMSDEWGTMVGNNPETSTYGQEYSYNMEDGTSSGVASYEPILGGDENPFRLPIFTTVKKRATPDVRSYQEVPVGESFFPSPTICYSRVTVKNLERTGVSRHATGKVVHEFYTAKDFPTITKWTTIEQKHGKTKPFSISAILKLNVKDHLTATQGFCVELNDMHGKPKAEKVYQENQTSAISSVEYNYKKTNYSTGAFKLVNRCISVDKKGNVSLSRIGEFFDMVADFREEKNVTTSHKLQMNIDVIPAAAFPIFIPMMWPVNTAEETRFRSATTTKVIQHFGILEEVVAKDLGSVVSTKNLAYDAETGDVLLSETTTNFNDHVYNLKYPAWWYYQDMGSAYKNIGFSASVSLASGIANVGSNAPYLREGDEVALKGSTNVKGWISDISGTTITVIGKDGIPINGSYTLTVIRSGYRNTLSMDMATITTLTNPLSSLKSNAYQNVLQASAVEYGNDHKIYCDCEPATGITLPDVNNPYVTGAKGVWKPFRTYTHLSARSHSNYDNNSNIRKDGVFTSYTPFYKFGAGVWNKDAQDWTSVSEVTEFNPVGEELENKDALGRYSSATFGYNQSMALSVAANSKYTEQGFDGFEDYIFNSCADDHFKFPSVSPTTQDSHTGRYSLKVSSDSSKTLIKQLAVACSEANPCNLSFIEAPTVIQDAVSVINGTAPYSYSWNVITGSPTITLTATGLTIGGNGSKYKIQINVTDANGCTATKYITNEKN